MKIAIIGGGAAGFFAAINCAEHYPEHTVHIFEKSNKLLSKVRISGGGRCNVTHACFENERLIEFYPRGMRELRNAFSRFSTIDTVNWFERRGVKLKTEADGRIFPVTDNSATVIQCLMNEAERLNVGITMNLAVKKIDVNGPGDFNLILQDDQTLRCSRVIVTTGGSPLIDSYEWLSKSGHTIVPPVPSLFTFNIPGSPLKGLEGISSPSVNVKLEGSKFESTGPLLITHWGLSGPAVLRLSAFAARWLAEKQYSAGCFLNWLPDVKEETVRDEIIKLKQSNPNKKIASVSFRGLPSRLWERLCLLSGIGPDEKCSEIKKIEINKLVHNCCGMRLTVKGKTTFKEEFVTCGGVSLKDVNMQTMESKIVKGMYFAGEVLDIDGVTGGFNFQSAWTTGYLAAVNAGKIIQEYKS